MVLAVVYLIGGILLAGFVIWLFVAGGAPFRQYLEAQGPTADDAWKAVLVVLGIGVMMIFFGLRTLLGKEGRMSRLAQLREERMRYETRTRESEVLRGPRLKG